MPYSHIAANAGGLREVLDICWATGNDYTILKICVITYMYRCCIACNPGHCLCL